MKRIGAFVIMGLVVSAFIVSGTVQPSSGGQEVVIKDGNGTWKEAGKGYEPGSQKTRPSIVLGASSSKDTITMGRLFVETDSKDARIRVLNIRPKFYQGMELRPGPYHVEVSAAGYNTVKKWIKLGQGEDKHLSITVVKTHTAGGTATPAGKTFTNTMGMKFVHIAPGTFMMGSPPDEIGRRDDEKQHQVTLTKGFYLGVTEVTQGQWESIMGTSPSYFKNCGDDCPVESVTWNDSREFILRLNQSENTTRYRLPTEAEWEYACRAGSQTAGYTGPIRIIGHNNAPALGDIACYGGNSCVIYSGAYECAEWPERQILCSSCGTQPVAGKKPNAWGLYDMLGNVWEWSQDWIGEYPSGHVTDPTGPSVGEWRVSRGGSWDSYAAACRAAARDESGVDDTDYLSGFRVAMTP